MRIIGRAMMSARRFHGVCEELTAPKAKTARTTSKPFISISLTGGKSNLLRPLFLLPVGGIAAPPLCGYFTRRAKTIGVGQRNRDYQQLSSWGLIE